MGKLHELLAVEPSIEKVYKNVLEEAKNTFSKKTEHFRGHNRTLKMRDDL